MPKVSNRPQKINLNFIHEVVAKNYKDITMKMITEKIIKDTTPLVPKSSEKNPGSGTLRASPVITSKSAKTGWVSVKYSRIVKNLYEEDGNGGYDENKPLDVAPLLYRGLNSSGKPVQHWTTEGTGPYWLKKSKMEHKSEWVKFFQEEQRRIWRERKRKQRSK